MIYFFPENRKFRSNLWYELPSKLLSSCTNGSCRGVFLLSLDSDVNWRIFGGPHVNSFTSTLGFGGRGCCLTTPLGDGMLGRETYGPILSIKVNLHVVQTICPKRLFQRRQFLLILFVLLSVKVSFELLDFPRFFSRR